MHNMKYSLVLLFIVAVHSEKLPQVEIPLGSIEGTLDETVNGKVFHSYEGIPYARPPVGKYRFKESVPPKPWKGVWKADTKYRCLQYNHFPASKDNPIEGTEDCLYVNVYTPTQGKNLDVFVYIHGGGFNFGAGYTYQPHILLDRDVIYVTLNYRLGPLGFLSTENDIVPGNNGLKDQILALKWVKENIKYFGGNPNAVTVSGMSAGGASAHFHIMSPKSKNLVNRAISMSGCMLNPWVIMENPLERSKELASLVGCDSANIESMVDCLRGRPGKQIVAVVGKFQPYMYNPFSPFGAVVDEWSSDPVLPKHPLILLKEGKVHDVPWIVSHTSGEGLYNGFDYYSDTQTKYIDTHWNEVMPHILHYNFTIEPSQHNAIGSKIRQEYLGKQDLTLKTFDKLIDLMGDRLFKLDLDKCTRLHAASVKSPVYHYRFNYRGAHSATDERTGTRENIGVSHGDDTYYVLKTTVDTLSTEEDRSMSKIMVDMFLSFASSGKPKTVVDWTPASKKIGDHLRYLRIDSPTSIKDDETEGFGNKQFWNSLPFNEGERLLNIKDEL